MEEEIQSGYLPSWLWLYRNVLFQLWSGLAPDGVTMFGGGRIDFIVVAGAKILPLVGMVELGLRKLISMSSHSDLLCSFWL